MIKKITYEDKVSIQNDENIARKNKVTDEDMNEIKEVVNCNAQDFETAKTDISNIKTEQTTQNTKITELETDNTTNKEDISNLKESVETIETDNTEKDKIISDLKEENQRLKEDLKGLPQGQASEESIDINDSAEMRVLEFEVEGNSRQESREGYNLIGLKDGTYTLNGITCIVLNGEVSISGTSSNTAIIAIPLVKEITLAQSQLYQMYAFNSKIDNNVSFRPYYSDGTRQNVFSNINNVVVYQNNAESVTLQNISIRVQSGATVVTGLTCKPMIISGSDTTKEYEQYGASPSPDYPSEVESCGDNVNLFDGEIESGNINSLGATYNDNTMIRSKSYTKVKPNTDIIIANNGIAIQANVVEYDKDYNFIVKTYVNADKITTNSQTNYIKFVCSPVDENKIKIEAGSIPTPYSKYGQGNINVEMCNKNLCDERFLKVFVGGEDGITYSSSEQCRSLLVKVEPNTTYTFKRSFITNRSTINEFSAIPKNLDKTYNKINFGNYDCTFTTQSMTKYILIYLSNNSEEPKCQLEEGTQATDYTPHKSQTYTIPVQKPLRKIGEYKDTFVKKNGKWYERHYIARKILDGIEEYNLMSSNAETGIFQYRTANGFISNLKTNPDPFALPNIAFCNYFNKITNLNANIQEGFTISGLKAIGFDTKFTSIDNFKSWLSEQYNAGTPVYIDYVLETPEDIECTSEQTEILNKIENEAKTYKGVTHIYSTDKVEPNMKVTYLKDIEMMIGG